jgi:glucosamine 6-phosphate synthetase-like amidotransferase/phosphosugar isomerase protein
MCGIFGLLLKENTNYSLPLLKSVTDNLFILSASRGKEAAGIAILSKGELSIHKQNIIGTRFIRTKIYNELFNNLLNVQCNALIREPIAIMGHNRLATNGTQLDNNNNSPIICDSVVGVHNGIIVNEEKLVKDFSLIRKGVTDSELIFSLLNLLINNGLSSISVTQAVFNKIQGSASIAAFVSGGDTLILATNTGSLYTCKNKREDLYIFASESYILEKLIRKLRLEPIIGQYIISQLKAGSGCLIDLRKQTEQKFNLN